MLRPPVSAARAALAALIAAASLTSEVGGAVEGGLGDFLNIPDSGLESPLGVREGFNFVTKPSTSSFFIAQQTMALLPKLLFPLFLHFLFWDPDNADPMSAASVEKAIDFMINPAIGVPRLYMISGLFLTALVMWALPMFLWPFRSILLPNADSKSKKRFGSLEVSEKISPVVIEEGELSEQFSKVIAPRGIMIFALLDIGFYISQLVFRSTVPYFRPLGEVLFDDSDTRRSWRRRRSSAASSSSPPWNDEASWHDPLKGESADHAF